MLDESRLKPLKRLRQGVDAHPRAIGKAPASAGERGRTDLARFPRRVGIDIDVQHPVTTRSGQQRGRGRQSDAPPRQCGQYRAPFSRPRRTTAQHPVRPLRFITSGCTAPGNPCERTRPKPAIPAKFSPPARTNGAAALSAGQALHYGAADGLPAGARLWRIRRDQRPYLDPRSTPGFWRLARLAFFAGAQPDWTGVNGLRRLLGQRGAVDRR